MSAEEELKAFQEELKKKEAEDMRLARSTATKFGALAVAVLIALVYSFFQQTQANKGKVAAEVIAHENHEFKETSELQLKQCMEEMEAVNKSLEACRTK